MNECSAFNSNPIKIDVNENDADGDDRRCDLNSNSSAFLGTSLTRIKRDGKKHYQRNSPVENGQTKEEYQMSR